MIRFIVGTQSLKFDNQVSLYSVHMVNVLFHLTLHFKSLSWVTYFFVNFQIHLIDFDDESNVINKNVFLHSAGEIW